MGCRTLLECLGELAWVVPQPTQWPREATPDLDPRGGRQGRDGKQVVIRAQTGDVPDLGFRTIKPRPVRTEGCLAATADAFLEEERLGQGYNLTFDRKRG